MKRALGLLLTVLLIMTMAPELGVLAEGTVPTGYSQSPILDALVADGTLPPVEERLPANPLVYSKEFNAIPAEDMDFVSGEYGGVMRLADPSAEGGQAPEMWCFSNEPPLMTPSIDVLGQQKLGNLRGNWLESYEANEDNTVFTFMIREGLKWSDGVPVTTEDVMFLYEDYYLYTGLGSVPLWLRANMKMSNNPGVIAAVDEYTFTITFDVSYPLLPLYLADPWNSYSMLMLPKHYMKQFHIKYTTLEEMAPALEEMQLESDNWVRLFQNRNTGATTMSKYAIGYPSICPWLYDGSPAQGVYTYRRNPYYFKVDYEGKQLPYIDAVEQVWVTDLSGQVMKAVAGEVDYAVNRTNVTDYPLFVENSVQEKPDSIYDVALLEQHVTPTDIFLNLTYEDPVWRQVVNTLEFRQALNYAINRESIIETVQLGYGEFPDIPRVPYEYDVEKANAILDSLTELGLDKRDSEGWRLGPDGERFVINFEVAVWTQGSDIVTEMVAQDWRDVGVYTTMKVIDTSLNSSRRYNNTLQGDCFWLDMHVWPCNPTAYHRGMNVIMDNWGVLWRNWYFNKDRTDLALDADGNPVKFEEPPAVIQEFISLMEACIEGTTQEERDAALEQAQQMISDNVFFFPIATSGYPMIFNKNMGNMPVNTRYGISAAYSGEQFFYKPE